MSTTNTAELKTWPERIYLQHGDEPDVPKFSEVYAADAVTWCMDQINDADVEYVLADLAGRSAAHGEQSKAADFHDDGLGLAIFIVIRSGMIPRIGRPGKDIIASLREWFAANQDADIYVLRSWSDEVGCQSIENGRELLQMEGDELPCQAGSSEQVSERPQEVYTVRDWIEAAWCAGYYHAGYTHDSAYSQHQAKEFADHALAGLAALSAPERKVMTDAEIAKIPVFVYFKEVQPGWPEFNKIDEFSCGRKGGEPLVKLSDVRAALNQQGEQTAPEDKIKEAK